MNQTASIPSPATLKLRIEYSYLVLSGLFVAFLIVCNLIANKFVTVDLGFLGFSNPFILSAGVLPYPLTFLITDVLSEFYGKKRTNNVIITGFVASFLILGVLLLGSLFNSIDGSPVDDETYNMVFKNSWRVMGASMVAYLAAQFVDVKLFHFWKGLTNGKHLWLRNNGSTILSQFVDTALVVSVLFIGVKSFDEIRSIIFDGWLFKAMIALLDTPIFYLLVYMGKRFFNLRSGEELAP
jgi:uncharacterized integral membrane protein (TIGR00697 family)